MKIFISHRRSDSERAKSWYEFLTKQGTACYLDVLDPTIASLNGKSVSEYLHQQLQACTHLLVIYTRNTIGSMWVPFEIGVGTERDVGIAIDLATPKLNLPEYLLEWPILTETAHYSAFASLINRDESNRKYAKSIGQRYSEQFHVQLKRVTRK